MRSPVAAAAATFFTLLASSSSGFLFCSAWSLPSSPTTKKSPPAFSPSAREGQNYNNPWTEAAEVAKAAVFKRTATAAAAAVLTAAAFGWTVGGGLDSPSNNYNDAFQFSLPRLHPPAVLAKEMASGTGSRVNKDPESLLRYGLPIQNKEVR